MNNQGYLRLSILFVLVGGIVAAGVFVWPGPLFRKVPIQGYVFMPKKDIAPINGIVNMRACSKKDLFEAANDQWAKKRPVSGIAVGLTSEDVKTVTDERGYFEVYERRYNLKNSFIVLSIGASGQIVKYPAISFPDAAKSTEKILHVININQNGKVEVSYLNDAVLPSEVEPRPVLMVHGFGPDGQLFKFLINRKKWNRIKTIAENDKVLEGFEFFLFEYPDDQDITISSKELSWAIERLTRIYDQKVSLLSYSMGGLVCRHYLVSDWYEAESVDKLLMVGVPNHGCDLAIMHFESTDEDGDGAAANQLMPGSDFIIALNYQTTDMALKKRLNINSALQDEMGLNQEIKYGIIAGEVTEEMLEKAEQSRGDMLRAIGSIVGAWNQLFVDVFGEGFDQEDVIKHFQDSADSGGKTLEQMVKDIPPGDLIVPIDSVLMPGIPYVELPHTHGTLIIPDNYKDPRYTQVKKFLIEGILDNPQQQFQEGKRI